MRIAVRLGVSQRILETQYYLEDLPMILRLHEAKMAEQQLDLISASSFPHGGSDSSSYREEMIDRLRRTADVDGLLLPGDEYDPDGVEKLRSMLSRTGAT